MSTDKEIKELEKNRRASARVIPIYAGLLVASAVAIWLSSMFFAVPAWVTWIVLCMTAFTLMGDIWNYFYCGRKLKTLKQTRAA